MTNNTLLTEVMASLGLLQTSLLVCALVLAYVMWMGNTSVLRDTPVGQLRRFIISLWSSHALSRVSLALSQSSFGRWCNRMGSDLGSKPSHAFQLFFCFLLGGGFPLWIYLSWSHLPLFHKIGSHVSVWSTFLVFGTSCFRDPGAITPKTISHYSKQYKYDRIIYFEDKECPTCKQPKPARSKHCRICNICVHRFDHHCYWINNCVGARTILHFVAWAGMTAFTCGYGSYLLISIAYHDYVLKYNLLGAMSDPQFQNLPSYVVLAQLIVHYVGIVYFAMTIFMMMVSVLLSGLTAYYLHLIYHNTTANEKFKLAKIKKAIRDYDHSRKAHAGVVGQRSEAQSQTTTKQRKKNKKDDNTLEEEITDEMIERWRRDGVYEIKTNGKITVRNIYRKSFLAAVGDLLRYSF